MSITMTLKSTGCSVWCSSLHTCKVTEQASEWSRPTPSKAADKDVVIARARGQQRSGCAVYRHQDDTEHRAVGCNNEPSDSRLRSPLRAAPLLLFLSFPASLSSLILNIHRTNYTAAVINL